MTTPAVGIDVSAFQETIPPTNNGAPWLFVVHKATEGVSFRDPQFSSRFPATTGVRGAYHYARPGYSDGMKQAQTFATECLAYGFRKGVDIWQLDCEAQGNQGINGATWAAFIEAFYAEAVTLLGSRGFVYMGWPWAVETLGVQLATQLVSKYPWWLPDYGVNDGQIHAVSAPFEVQADIVLHQFSSAGGLDRNVIYNAAAYGKVMAPPIDLKAIAALVALVKALTLRPLKQGDKGPNVARLNGLLTHHGYVCAGDAYGAATVLAVHDFKRRQKLKNRDGKVCGRACILALFK